jgi:hypothetical protein
MRQIALGILCSGLIATSAFADEPATSPLRLDRALDGVSFLQPALKLNLTPAPAAAQAAAPDPKVKVTVGADFPTVYYFRGYRQETDAAFTFQPFVDVGVTANDKVSLNLGTWNSAHTGSNKDAGYGWYETDLYAAVTMPYVKATYTAYTYPSIDDSAIHELMFSGTYDDSSSKFPLAPSAAIAFELSKSSGADKGIYLELGVTPGIPLKDDAPVAITVPIKFGFSLKDYYGGDGFGYFSGGVAISVPINDIFEVHGSAIGYAFGNSLETYNGKSGDFVGSIGFALSF